MSETESIISETNVFSFVQVRGSMPFYWDQKGLKTVNISRPIEATMPVFKKHFNDMRADYNDGQVFALNLVTTHSSMEKMLLDNYEYLLSVSGFLKEQLSYQHFDFHQECAKNTDPLVELVDSMIYHDFISKMGIFK